MISSAVELPQKPKRHFLPDQLSINSWEIIEGYTNELLARPIENKAALEQWLRDLSELETVIGEDFRWRYVRMSCDTSDAAALQAVTFFHSEIEPRLKVAQHKLHTKLMGSPLLKELDAETYNIYFRNINKSLELHREENLPIFKQIRLKQQEYPAIQGEMSISYQGNEYTLQQAGNFLRDGKREVRETIYRQIMDRRLEDKDRLDDLFTELAKLRHQVAINAGFENYRDYKFADLGRFDYTVADCMQFHEAIAEEVVPIVDDLQKDRKAALGVEQLRPWDQEVDISGQKPLQPFEKPEELIEKTISCLGALHPYFGERLTIMRELGYLDLESRMKKAPGGYNMTMPEIGVPFIFMNATGTDRDVRTMIHEAGHAVHTFLSHPLELNGFKSYPSEVAELASMSMELLTMDFWDTFYDNAEDLKRAKITQLEGIFKTLPWVATVDAYQHWLYTHPGHTKEERKTKWVEIMSSFASGVTDWTGIEAYKAYAWQKQLHIYEVPFYYIEYAMAQLGAVAMWRQYKQQPEQAVENYIAALKLGYTKPITEIYKTAGIEFRFDKAYVHELMTFLKAEFDGLK